MSSIGKEDIKLLIISDEIVHLEDTNNSTERLLKFVVIVMYKDTTSTYKTQ